MGAAGRSDRRDHGADDPISRDCQQGEAEQKKEAAAATTRSRSSSRMEQMGSSRYLFGIQEDFQQLRGEAHEQELMILQLRSMMQEHLSTSASQPASHASEFKSHAKREAQPHLNLNSM
jgi:hypothetical protein